MHEDIYYGITSGSEERGMINSSKKRINPLWCIRVIEPYTVLQNNDVNLSSPSLQDLPIIPLRGKSRGLNRGV